MPNLDSKFTIIPFKLVHQFGLSVNEVGYLSDFYLNGTLPPTKALKRLVARGFLDHKTYSPEEAVEFLSHLSFERRYSPTIIPPARCEWCGSSVLFTAKHHYPIPKINGGVETVEICPLCHQDFHSLIQTGTYSVRQDVADEILAALKLYRSEKGGINE